MRTPLLILLVLCAGSAGLSAQAKTYAPYEIFAGSSSLSNSFNGVPGARQPLVGWEAAVAFPTWHHLRFVIDYTGLSGENLGAGQHPSIITAGGQYEHKLGRETLFGQALFGDVRLNPNWGPNGALGGNCSFTTFFGGGVDTPINAHLALRVQGGYQYTDFALYVSNTEELGYKIPGLPDNFARASAGLVWSPYLKPVPHETQHSDHRVDSELVSEFIGSFGHYHIFASSWYSNVHLGGVEYDRNSWGRFIGAQMDYTGDILPLAILTQPTQTNFWGNDLNSNREHVGGLAITPIGVRLMWFDTARVKPYYFVKGGMIFFTKKALSPNASYENFTLQQSVGLQFKLAGPWDLRTGFEFFHFSNAFIVPSNPGLDSLTYNVGLSYHLGKHTTSQ